MNSHVSLDHSNQLNNSQVAHTNVFPAASVVVSVIKICNTFWVLVIQNLFHTQNAAVVGKTL